MKLRLTLALLLVAACKKAPIDGGIIAAVQIDTAAHVTCVELSVSDIDGKPLTSKRFPLEGRTKLELGIAQAGDPNLPDDVRVRAQGLWSESGCTMPASPNAAPVDQEIHFVAARVDRVDFTIRAPGPTDDSDGDGYTGSTRGGPDCDDSVRSINPGAAEACSMPVDFNCNGRIGCDDSACTGVACVRPAISLAFANMPLTATSTLCSAAIIIEARDSQDMPAPVSSDVMVTLTEQGALGLQFFADSGCSLPATSRAIARMQKEVRFYVRAATAGLTRIDASASGFTSVQQDFRINPGPAASIAFATAPQTVKSDACSQAVTVQARDASGNAAPVAANVPLTIAAMPMMGTALFSDASCTTPLMTPALISGTPSLTFYFKPTRAPGMVTLNAAAGTLGMAMQTETIIPGDPTRIVFVTGTQTVVAGACSTPMTVKLLDAQGTDTTAPASTAIMLSGPTMTFYTSSNCAAGTSVTMANIIAGSGTLTVYFTATGAGTPVVTASGAGLTLATQMQTVNPAPAVRLGFTTGAQGVQTTQCSGPVRLSTLDAFGNPSNVTAALPIMLSASPSTGFSFYLGMGCSGSATTSTSIPLGGNTITFSYRGNTAGIVTMTADSALDPDPTQVTNVGVMPPSNLVYLTNAQTRIANECSGPVTLEARDMGGNRSNVASALTINLVAAPAMGFGFFADANCSTPITSVTMAASSAQVSFHFQGTNAVPVTMTPTSTLTGPGPQIATIRPATASQLAFLAPARSIIAGGCSASLTVQTRDSFMNVAPVTADLVLNLSGAPSTGLTFHSDASCATAPITTATITATNSQAVFYARGTIAPSYTLQAQGSGVGMTTQPLSVTAAAAAKLVVITGAQALQTGQCSGALTFERRDQFENPITVATPLTVMLTGGAGISFYSTAGCSGPIGSTAIPASQQTVTVYFRGITPGSPSVTGTGAGVATPGIQTETITVSPPTVLAFTGGSQTMVVAGTVSAPLTLQSRDAFGNPSPVSGNTVITLGMLPTSYVYCGDAACAGIDPVVQISGGFTDATFWFRGNVAQTFTINATSAVGMTSQMETVIPAAASQLVFTTSPQTRNAGACSQVTTVQRQDAFNNPVTTGGALALTLTPVSSMAFSFHSTTNCVGGIINGVTIAASASSASFYFNGTVPATVQITAAGGSLTSAQQNETIAVIPADRIVFTTPQQTATAGVCTGPFTVESRDQYMNTTAVGGATIVNLSASGPANATFFSDSGCATLVSNVTIPAMGTTASFWLKATGVGTMHQLFANNPGLIQAQQTLPVNAATPTQLLFTTGPQSFRVGACSAIANLRTADQFNNTSGVPSMTTLTPSELPLAGVSFWQDSACSVPLATMTLNMGQSTASFYMKGGNTIQMVSVTVTPSNGAIAPAGQNETITLGTPNKLVFTSGAKNLMAGECSGQMTVQSQDVGGNMSPVTSATNVNLAAAPSTGVTFYSDSACATPSMTTQIPASGSSASFSMRGITGSSPTVTATGIGIMNSATQMQTIQPAVRTGTCTIADTTSSIACTISPALNDLGKTFFLFQATSSVSTPDDTFIRCELTNLTTLTCDRAGTQSAVSIRWYTVSSPNGLSVQHIPSIVVPNGGANPTSQVISSVNTGSTFVLMSTSLAGTPLSDNRVSSVKLLDATHVEIRRGAAPDVQMTHSIQVVEWTAATVDHGGIRLNDNTASVSTAVTSSTNPAFLVHSWRYGQNSTNEICRIGVRGTQTDAGVVTFTRGAGGNTACDDEALDIEFQRVRFPTSHRVEATQVSIAAMAASSAPVAIAAPTLDLTRSVAFFGGQTFAGQAIGETTDQTLSRLRDAVARASFSDAMTVQVQRDPSTTTDGSPSLWTLFVWQLVP